MSNKEMPMLTKEQQKHFMGFNGFTWWIGVVEDNNDPEKLGRVRIRCLGLHTENKNELPTEDLPWATPMMPLTSGSISQIGQAPTGLQNGSWVVGFFRDNEDCQDPVVMGSFYGYPMERPNTDLGFCDASGTHPIEIEEPDTSRLARGLTTSKVYQAKKALLDLETQDLHTIANVSDTWASLSNPYAARYPFNKVNQTESGHVIELDDTPNAERINIQHKSGTFLEFHPNGDIRVLGKNGEVIIQGGLNVHITGNVNLTCDNAFNHHVKGNYSLQIDGTKTEVVTGLVSETYKANQTTKITGKLDLDASSEVDVDAGIINLN